MTTRSGRSYQKLDSEAGVMSVDLSQVLQDRKARERDLAEERERREEEQRRNKKGEKKNEKVGKQKSKEQGNQKGHDNNDESSSMETEGTEG